VGWPVVVAGAVSSALTRVHYDACGQPANLPGPAGFYSGAIACVLAASAFGMAMWLHECDVWEHATKVVVTAGLLGAAGALLVGWFIVPRIQLCG
ncbi:MAG: hypothetical protein LC799_28850, partial [Actinobacteria bacterium]|nr:hypothetical protein [Actinomycetota bacterium]